MENKKYIDFNTCKINKSIFTYSKTLHSFTDVDEVCYHFVFLWWYIRYSIVGKGVLRNHYKD